MPKKLTTIDFTRRAKALHQGKYDYSATEYVHSKKKVQIICKMHGPFWQLAKNHIDKNKPQGCPKCQPNGQSDTRRFIQSSVEMHGKLYDYSKVEYRAAHSKVIVICKIHGQFSQSATAHLSGKGCPYCANKTRNTPSTKTTDGFIQEARSVHGSIYDYSTSNYTGALHKIEIVCPSHGPFLQVARNHLLGFGCKDCTGWGFKRREFILAKGAQVPMLYFIKCQHRDEVFYKIGITKYPLKKRFIYAPFSYSPISYVLSNDAGYIYDLEKRLAILLKLMKYLPEVKFGGRTECYLFPSEAEISQLLKSLLSESATFFSGPIRKDL